MYQLLLVEDDVRIREVICDYFADKDFALEIVENGAKALDLLYENTYDCVLLDVMLPGIDGFEICKEIRRAKDTPILFLTARGREEDILHGYDLGCDDYIVKPFSLATLYAKIKAVLNRAKGTVLCEELSAGPIKLNPRKMEVFVNDVAVDMPPKQYLLLKILLESKGAVVSRDVLISRIWGYDYDGEERILDNHIKILRQALGSEGKRIKTMIRRGYKIEE